MKEKEDEEKKESAECFADREDFLTFRPGCLII